MNWKKILKCLEQQKDWDTAIEFMQNIIDKNPNDLDAYLFMNYLLMDLLVEEHCEKDKRKYYETLIKKYYDESYAKFSHNPEYLYYTGRTAFISEWFFGIDIEDAEKMISEARRLDPDNLVYKEDYYYSLASREPEKLPEVVDYAQLVLVDDSPIKKALSEKGSLGEYILGMMTYWAKEVMHE